MANLTCGRYILTLSAVRPLVMGILNVTPDSFSDGGQFAMLDKALAHAQEMIHAGVDIIDVGGESTRPGAALVSVKEELARVLPIVKALRDCGKPLSIDTYKPEVMHACLAEGADMINDVNALQAPGALEAVKQSHCAICLMHKQGSPQTMQMAPNYDDVVDEVRLFLIDRLHCLQTAGISMGRIVLDPGFGFGKKLAHNLALANTLLKTSVADLPWLVGVSRKAMLGQLTGHDVSQRVLPSIVAALALAQQGASIVRVHDVAETIEAFKVWQALTGLPINTANMN